jgi:hypothetical protein
MIAERARLVVVAPLLATDTIVQWRRLLVAGSIAAHVACRVRPLQVDVGSSKKSRTPGFIEEMLQ